jgi:hypothetical protein
VGFPTNTSQSQRNKVVQVAKQFYLRRNSKVVGPISDEAVKKQIGRGKIQLTDEIGGASAGPWKLVSDVPALAKLIEPPVDAYGDDAYGDDAYQLPPAKQKKKKTQVADANTKRKKPDQEGLSVGLIALLCVGAFLFLGLVVGGGILVANNIAAENAAENAAKELRRQETLARQAEEDRLLAERRKAEEEELDNKIQQLPRTYSVGETSSAFALATLKTESYIASFETGSTHLSGDLKAVNFLMSEGFWQVSISVSKADPFRENNEYRLSCQVDRVVTIPDRNDFKTPKGKRMYDERIESLTNGSWVIHLTEDEMSSPQNAFTQQFLRVLRVSCRE